MANKTKVESLAAKLETAAAKAGMEPLIALTVTNPNWDPAKHPHGKHGHWAKKGEAVYHALMDLATMGHKAKKGTYTSSGVAGHPSGSGTVLVGGVTVNPPSGEKGPSLSVDYALHKGETAYKVTTGTSDTVVVTHPDNSATELKPTPHDEPPTVIKQFKPGEFQVHSLKPGVTATTLDSVHGLSVTQATKAGKKGQLVALGPQVGMLPVGTVLRKRNVKYSHVWEDWTKQDDGSWKRTGAFKANTKLDVTKDAASFAKMVESPSSSFVVHEEAAANAPQVPAEAPLPQGQKVTSIEHLQQLHPETEVQFMIGDGSIATFVKGAHDEWHAKSGGGLLKSSEMYNSYKDSLVVTSEGMPDWEKELLSPAPLAVGDKVGPSDLADLPAGTVLTNAKSAKFGAGDVIKAHTGNWYHTTGAMKFAKAETSTEVAAKSGDLTIKSLPPESLKDATPGEIALYVEKIREAAQVAASKGEQAQQKADAFLEAQPVGTSFVYDGATVVKGSHGQWYEKIDPVKVKKALDLDSGLKFPDGSMVASPNRQYIKVDGNWRRDDLINIKTYGFTVNTLANKGLLTQVAKGRTLNTKVLLQQGKISESDFKPPAAELPAVLLDPIKDPKGYVEALPVGTLVDYHSQGHGKYTKIAPNEWAHEGMGGTPFTDNDIYTTLPYNKSVSVNGVVVETGSKGEFEKKAPLTSQDLTVMASAHVENHVGTSDKFYESAVVTGADGKSWHLTRYGSTKPNGNVTVNAKEYSSISDAMQAHKAIVSQKIKTGGYTSTGAQHLAATSHAGYKQDLINKLGGAPEPDLVPKEAGPPPKVGVVLPAIGDEITDPNQLDTLPIGSVIRNTLANNPWGEYQKDKFGAWLKIASHNSVGVGKAFSAAEIESFVKSQHKTVTLKSFPGSEDQPQSLEQLAPAAFLQNGDLVESLTQILDLPPGSVVQYSGTGVTYTKTPSGEWFSDTGKVIDPGNFKGAAASGKLKLASYGSAEAEQAPKEASGKVPGTDVTLGPGESLYGSISSKAPKWAVVKDGKVIKLLDKATGADLLEAGLLNEGNYKSALWNWNKSLKDGKLELVSGDAQFAAAAQDKYSVGATIDSKIAQDLPIGTQIQYMTSYTSSAQIWTKQPNGKWQSKHGTEVDTGNLNWDDKPWTIFSLPADFKPPKSAKPAAAPKAKPVKVVEKSPNTSHTLENGKVLTPGPGEHLLKPPMDFGMASAVSAWVLNSEGKVVLAYDNNGNPYPTYYKSYKPGGKKSVKALVSKGAELLASGPTKDDVQLPVGESTKSFSNVSQLNDYTTWGYWHQDVHVRADLKKLFAAEYKSDPEDPPYSTLRNPEVGQQLANIISSINDGREKFKAQLTASEKSKITKTVKSLTGLLRLSVLAQRLDEQGHEVSPQDWAEISEIDAIDPPNGMEDLSGAVKYWKERLSQQEFLQGVKDLGFDPLNATPEQAQQYVASKGASFASAMSVEDAKNWMMLDLKAPGFTGSKDQIELKAGASIKFAAIAANAEAVAAKKKDLEASKAEQASEKAKAAKVYASYSAIAKMHAAYDGPNGHLFYDYETGTWFHDKLAIDSSAAAEMVKDPEQKWAPAGELIESPAQQIAQQLKVKFGDDWTAAGTFQLAQLGCSGAGMLSARREWLRAYLRGDQVAMYQIEKKYGSPDPSHPGASILVQQSLSNWLHAQKWWHSGTDASAWPAEDVDAAGEALGLFEAEKVLIGPPSNDKKLMLLGSWIGFHQGLPPPQGTGETKPVTFKNQSGYSIVAQPGDLVAKHGNDYYQVFSELEQYSLPPTGDVNKSGYSGTGVMSDKISAHAHYINSGWTDATPAWDLHALGEEDIPGLKVPKPIGFPKAAWDTATGVEAGGAELKALIGQYATMPDEEIANAIVSVGVMGSGLQGKDRYLLAQAPEPVQRFAVWASALSSSDPQFSHARDTFKAILLKARGGEYIQPEQQKYKTSTGATIVIPPGAALYETGGEFALITGSSTGFALNSAGQYASGLASYMIESITASSKKLTESFANLTPEKAALEGFEFSHATWDALSEAEAGGWAVKGPEAAAAYQFKQALENVPDQSNLEQFQALVAQIHSMPPGVKSFLVQAALDKNVEAMNAATWKIGKGFYTEPVQPSTPAFNPAASYASAIAEGKVSAADISSWWEFTWYKEFIQDTGMPQSLLGQYSSKQEEAIAAKIAEIQANAAPVEATDAPIGDPAKDLLLTKVGSAGGSHGATKWTDQYGDLWMSKNFPGDPYNEMRTEAEHYGNVIGRLFGFHTPQTFTKNIDGTHSYVQHWDDAIGTLQGATPGDLNDEQLSGVMQTQVLNWLISNHDGYGANFLKHPDGKSIIAIDLGQTFKHHHDDKLEVGYLPPENFDKEWYDSFYKAVQSGKVDRERAEKIAQRVLFKAYQVQSQNDTRFAQLAGEMLDHRPKGAYPKKYPNKQALIDAALERKHSLVADFEKLYKGVWKDAGWDWKIDTSDFGKRIGDAHVAVGPQFCEDLGKAKAAGQALMVDSRDLMDSHIVMTPMKAFDGGTTLLGFARLCGEADKAVTAWLKERVEGPLQHIGEPQIVVDPSAVLPDIEPFHQSIVAYAKTLFTHAPKSSGGNKDGEYNKNTISSADTYAGKVSLDLATVKKWRQTDPTTPLSKGSIKFSTLEQQDAWVAAAEQKLLEYNMCKKAKEQGSDIQTAFPGEVQFPPGFKPISYEPSKNLGEPGKIAEKYTDGNSTYIRTADGGHYKISKSGAKEWLSREDFLNEIAGLEKVPVTDSAGSDAVEKWIHADGKLEYVRDKEDPHYWLPFEEGKQIEGNKLTQAELDEIMSYDSESWTYDNGEAVEEKTVSAKTESGKQIKVSHQQAATHSGAVNFKTGELVEQKSGPNTEFQHGTEYVVNYDGVTIRYRPWLEPQVKKAQQGNLSFELKAWDGTPAQIEDVIDTLRDMGISIDPADAQSLELQYWRHITEQSKIDGSKNSTAVQKVPGELANKIKPGMTAADELQAHRDAWAKAIGQDKVDSATWEPQFSTLFNQKAAGKPQWLRPDFTLQDLYKMYGNGQSTPIHAASSENGAVGIIQTSAVFPSEERVRILGNLYQGASSYQDQNNNASGFVFCRQNTNPWGHGSSVGGSYGFILDPRDALKATNYAIASDKFGDRDFTVGSFNPTKMYSLKSGSNELMIKDVAAIRYCVVESEHARTSLISRLKAEGTTEVNGVPVDQFVIGPDKWQAKMAEVWKEILEAEKEKAAA